ncbi:acyltransferase family protein, partial [Rhodoplanes sp. SY1]|uniref:acyltransferase family protein n=1 Tax=Rhodoplanes sp. SY1 TaxID=3166646 RepID=UPI0038B54BD9
AAVVLFHGLRTGETYFVDRHSVIFGVFQHGFVGVDLFFAISGFIIFYTVTRSGVSRGRFLLHRAERIAPIYWCATFAMLALIIGAPGLFRPRDGWGTLDNVLQSLSFTTFWTGSMPVIYVGWSLEFEVLFYLAVGLFLGTHVSPWTVVPVGFSALVAIGALTGVQAP